MYIIGEPDFWSELNPFVTTDLVLITYRYQSLHTVVMTEENIQLEIQVRTKEMHFQAECGLAAHWKYKQEQGSI